MLEWLKREYPDFFWWLGLPCAAFVVFLATLGTGWHQFGIGLLAAAVTMLIAMALFECAYRIVTGVSPHGGTKGGEAKNSRSR